MTKVGIFFSTTTGNTELAAERIEEILGGDVSVELNDVYESDVADMADYDVLILGSSTWDTGDLSADWLQVAGDLENFDFSGKSVAVFGYGDAFGYPDWFCDAVGILHDTAKAGGARIAGHTSTSGYSGYASSAKSLINGSTFAGLCLDDDNQPELTDGRIRAWCRQIRSEIGF